MAMTLLIAVLVAVGVTSQYSSWRVFNRIIDDAIERTLSYPPSKNADRERMPRIARVIVADFVIDADGNTKDLDPELVSISDEDIAVIAAAASGEDDSGTIDSSHFKWERSDVDDGWRVVVADFSGMDRALFSQFRNNFITITISLVILSFITWRLSKPFVRPIEDALVKQQRFIADASHELKTPLSAIIANNQILLKNSEQLPEASRKWLLATDEETLSMQTLLNDMLDLAKSEDHTRTRRREPVELSRIVEAVALAFEAAAYEHGCTILCDAEDGLCLRGDAEELQRMVEALVENACEHADPGSAIGITLRKRGGGILLEVANDGVTIPEEDLPHVFDRFWRSDKSRTREGSGGYGLGLSIAKAIAESHGGEISARSSNGRTVFSVVF